MSLKINSLKKDGNALKEYLLLEATENINLSDYAIVDRTFDADGNVSNLFKHFFRFPPIMLNKGEQVLLFTGKGINGKGLRRGSGILVHSIYWGSDAPVWNDANTESVEVLKVATVTKQLTGNSASKKKLSIKRPSKPSE